MQHGVFLNVRPRKGLPALNLEIETVPRMEEGSGLDRNRSRSEAIRNGHYLSTGDIDFEGSTDVVETLRDSHTFSVEGDYYQNIRSSARTSTVSNDGKSKAESPKSSKTAFRRSLLPAPLRPKSNEDSASTNPNTSQPPSPMSSVRVYGGSASKVQEYFGADRVDVHFSRLAAQPKPVRDLEMPSVPLRAWRSSFDSLSMTPSEMPYPIDNFRSYSSDNATKAEQMLGLRRQGTPPPVPPKNPRRSVLGWDSQQSLLLHTKEATSSAEALEPLNGKIAWLHSITGLLVVFNCWGMANAYGLFQAYYERMYLPDKSPASIAWIGSTQLAMVFGLGVPVGRLVDKGYFKLVFHGGSAIMILGLFCTSVCKHLWSLWLVNGLVTGLGMGMCFCSGIVVLMTWFDERNVGKAIGLGATGSCIGAIVYVLLARHFLPTHGFRTTMCILAGVAFVTMIPSNLVFKIRGQKNRSKPGRRGSRVFTKQKVSWRMFAGPSYMLAAGGMFFFFLGIYFGFVYMISFASTVLHLDDAAATNLLIFMLAANLPGRFLPGLISDQCIGPLNTIIPSTLLSSAIIWLWAASGDHNRGSLTLIACFYGFVSAGIQALYAPTVYTFCLEPVLAEGSTQDSRLAMDRVGLKAGLIFSCIGIACLIGLPIGGALISYRVDRGMDQPYLGAQIFAGLSLLVGGCLLLSSRVAKAGWEGRDGGCSAATVRLMFEALKNRASTRLSSS